MSRERWSQDVLTLRGEVDFITPDSKQVLLFSYEAPDLTRGWKIEGAYVWLKGANNPAGSRARFNLAMQLQTDTISPVNNDLTAEDNRAFGWFRTGYIGSDAAGNVLSQFVEEEHILDPQHIITRDMYGTFTFDGDSVLEDNDCTLCYLVIMKPVKLLLIENILQTVKGVAQDILN